MPLKVVNKKMLIEIYTDGSCIKTNGGYAAYFKINENEYNVIGNEKNTTNNRMELKAVIEVLKFIQYLTIFDTSKIIIYSDSKYVINGITIWIINWINKGWGSIKNKDLWLELYNEVLLINNKISQFSTEKREIEWKWVKGHSNNIYNNKVDVLAKQQALLL